MSAVLAWTDLSTLSWWPSSISSADHSVAHPPRYPDGWFWRGCRDVWHARTMQVSISTVKVMSNFQIKGHRNFTKCLLSLSFWSCSGLCFYPKKTWNIFNATLEGFARYLPTFFLGHQIEFMPSEASTLNAWKFGSFFFFSFYLKRCWAHCILRTVWMLTSLPSLTSLTSLPVMNSLHRTVTINIRVHE